MSHLLSFLNNYAEIPKNIPLDDIFINKKHKIEYFSINPLCVIYYKDKKGFKNNFFINPDIIYKLSKPSSEFIKYDWFFQLSGEKLYIIGKTLNENYNMFKEDFIFIEVVENKNEIIKNCF